MHAPLLVAACLLRHALAHGSHDTEAAAGKSYMERHMASERSQKRDTALTEQPSIISTPLIRVNYSLDGILDRSELEAIYGVHHETMRSSAKSEEHHQSRTEEILQQVLDKLDFNKDGVVTKGEFLEGLRRGGMPDFNEPTMGHHYHEEDEYFLHHEEIYHNTPETQTDESYNHPEDIAHFANHEAIEAKEEALIMKAQGLDADGNPLEESAQHSRVIPDDQQHDAQVVFDNLSDDEKARLQRANDASAQARKYAAMGKEASARGSMSNRRAGGSTFRGPKDAAGVPSKFKVRGSFFGDF